MIDVYPSGTTYVDHTFEKKANTFRIVTDPKGAEIFIDGVYQGKTDLLLTLGEGQQHSIRLSLPGYYTYNTTVILQERVQHEIESIYHDFIQLPENGTLSIQSIPYSAEISLDGVIVGNTNIILKNVKPGTHSITLRKYGFDDYSVSFQTSVEKQEEVNVTLRPQDGILNIDSRPVNGGVYIDGAYVGNTPYTGQFIQGKHKIEIKSDAFDSYIADIDLSLQGFASVVDLTPQAISEISKSEKKIEENQKYGVSSPQAILDQSKHQLQTGDYVNAFESAQKAGILAEDIDEDGIPNWLDIQPSVKNNYIYSLPFIFLVMFGGVIYYDWRKCRVNPNMELKLKNACIGQDTFVTIKPIVDNAYLKMVSTIYVDDIFLDMVEITGEYEANLGSLSPGRHILTVELQVKQKRYGNTKKINETTEFNVT
jgi:hypothetical protein